MFKEGQKYRVTKHGCRLLGVRPVTISIIKLLMRGEIITCDGESVRDFGNGPPITKWRDGDGRWIAGDCEFFPVVGIEAWKQTPDLRCLELVTEDAR